MSLRILKYDFHGVCLTTNSYGRDSCFGIDGNRYIPIAGIAVGIIHTDSFGLYVYCLSYQQSFAVSTSCRLTNPLI